MPDDYVGKIDKEAGVFFIPVKHEGNTQASEEEASIIRDIANELLGRRYTDRAGSDKTIGWADILFVTPYNHQRTVLSSTLGENARVGTVDKFQGQEAPVVFVSLCASHADEAPRGLEFIFNKNSLNVAISRAKSLVFVVGSPDLALSNAANMKQARLLNLACRIMEKSITL